MPIAPCVNQLPSLQDVLQCSPSSTCIYYLPEQRRSCKLSPSIQDLVAAKDFRDRIGNEGRLSRADLQSLALLLCCKRWHRQRIQDFQLLEPLIDRWHAEVRSSSPPRKSESGLHEPQPQETSSRPSVQDETQITAAIDLSAHYKLRSRRVPVNGDDQAYANINSTGFRKHKQPTSRTVASKLLQPLTMRDQRPGNLYIYERDSSPGFVKIGLTTTSVHTRLQAWQKQCGYEPKLVAQFNDVPNVYRAESLAHFELAEYWRSEVRCRNCSTQHREWFEVDKSYAAAVAKSWVQWLQEAQPYEQEGSLSPIWLRKIRSLVSSGVLISADLLLREHSSLQKPIPHEVLSASPAQIDSRTRLETIRDCHVETDVRERHQANQPFTMDDVVEVIATMLYVLLKTQMIANAFPIGTLLPTRSPGSVVRHQGNGVLATPTSFVTLQSA